MSAKLTTIFTPPASCTNKIWRMTWDARNGLYYGLLGGSYSSYMPNQFKPDSSFFYSPGLYCPAGYSAACSSTTSIGLETATIATCCPTGYSCQQRSRDGAWPWEFTLGCTSACLSSFDFTYRDSSTVLDESCFVGAGFNAYSVQLRFRAADLISDTTSSTDSTAFATSAAVTRFTPTSNAPTHTGALLPSSDDELSTGAKAGVGVGSALGAALIVAGCWVAWVLYKKSKNGHQYSNYDQPELVTQTRLPHDPKDPDSRVSLYPSNYVDPQYAFNNVDNAHREQAQSETDRYELSATI